MASEACVYYSIRITHVGVCNVNVCVHVSLFMGTLSSSNFIIGYFQQTALAHAPRSKGSANDLFVGMCLRYGAAHNRHLHHLRLDVWVGDFDLHTPNTRTSTPKHSDAFGR